LGSTLRECVESARALGAVHRWRPRANTEAASNWQAAAQDLSARTLCEADVQAITLLHSGYEHAAATGQSISAGRPFLPHTLARTAMEHLLRAQHLLDMEAAPDERIRRRLNEWLYAIVESNYRRQGLLNMDPLTTGELDPLDFGTDKATMLAAVDERAAAVGETITTVGRSGKKVKVPYVAGSTGRATSMSLAETYTAGGAAGIPSFTMRGHSALIHGTEIGLLSCFSGEAPPDPTLGRVTVPRPAPMEPPTLAFSLLGVLLTVVNATDVIRDRFGWPADSKADRRQRQAATRAADFWATAINAG
jgi:hypothetical protein